MISKVGTEQHEVHWDMSFRDWMIVLGASLGAFLAILDIQITNASLAEIQGAFNLESVQTGWISTAYLMAEIMIIPLAGYLSEAFGLRLFMLISAVGFLITSALCGLAWSFESLLLFRVLQGLTGGTLVPMAFQILLQFMPAHRRNVGLALFGLVSTLAPTLGPTVGGYLTEWYGWRANFFLNLLPGAVMLWILARSLPYTMPQLHRLRAMDKWGAGSLGLSLGALIFMLEEGARKGWFESEEIVLAGAFCVVGVVGLLLPKRPGVAPILEWRLLLDRNFSLSALITMGTAAALFGGVYALSLFLSQVQAYRPLEIGAVMMWVGIPQLLVMPLMPKLMDWIDHRLLIALGMILFIWSNELNTGLTWLSASEHFQASLVIRALGQPLILIPLSAIAMAGLRPSQSGSASALFNVVRNVGGSIGIALTSTLLLRNQSGHFVQLASQSDLTSTAGLRFLSNLGTQLYAQGADPRLAQGGAVAAYGRLIERESLVLAFNDVYAAMVVVLVICSVCVFLVKSGRRMATGNQNNEWMH